MLHQLVEPVAVRAHIFRLLGRMCYQQNGVGVPEPAGRMGTPEEVAELAFAITKKNDYLTGQIITLDGGWI